MAMLRRVRPLLVGSLVLVIQAAGETHQVPQKSLAEPRHYLFVNGDRDRIRDTAFLNTPAFAGAEVKYTWRELEPSLGQYNVAPILEDLSFLTSHGKRLVVQLQDVSFDDRVNVPEYLRTAAAYGGGAARQFETVGDDDSGARFGGWVARRWDPEVRRRFAGLLQALGRALDGRIEALVLPETSVGFGSTGKLYPAGFTPAGYVLGINENMTAAREAFTRSHVIQYANFMPGEWLPGDDRGYLRAVYAHAARMTVGVGGPDLLPHRRGQQNHSYPLIAARPAGIVAGVAVQDGNLAERDPATGRLVTVRDLHTFARDRLQVNYIFWGTEEPYFTSAVVPYLRQLGR